MRASREIVRLYDRRIYIPPSVFSRRFLTLSCGKRIPRYFEENRKLTSLGRILSGIYSGEYESPEIVAALVLGVLLEALVVSSIVTWFAFGNSCSQVAGVTCRGNVIASRACWKNEYPLHDGRRCTKAPTLPASLRFTLRG